MVTGINLTPGELRTRIRVQRCVRSRPDGEIEETESWIDLGNDTGEDPPRYKRCQWIGVHGAEAWTDDALMGTQQATIRLRFWGFWVIARPGLSLPIMHCTVWRSIICGCLTLIIRRVTILIPVC